MYSFLQLEHNAYTACRDFANWGLQNIRLDASFWVVELTLMSISFTWTETLSGTMPEFGDGKHLICWNQLPEIVKRFCMMCIVFEASYRSVFHWRNYRQCRESHQLVEQSLPTDVTYFPSIYVSSMMCPCLTTVYLSTVTRKNITRLVNWKRRPYTLAQLNLKTWLLLTF